MCRNFETISGKRNRGNKSLLQGLTKMYRDAHYRTAIISIPVEIMEIDTRYQTMARTNRDLGYLIKNWNENKLLPLIGVPHWETGKVYLVDGYGRWIASQVVDKEFYKCLDVLLILNAPNNPSERLKFEAEIYAYQNKDIAKMTPIHKHGSMLVLHDKATETLEKLREKYKFEYSENKGNREASVLGSYTDMLRLCSIDNGLAAEYVLDICKGAGFDRKPNGYSSYVVRGLGDIYRLYDKERELTKKFLIKYLRNITPLLLKSNAVSKYSTLDFRAATSLYLEDLVVEHLALQKSRQVIGTRLVAISKTI